jgi:hypothetical protein
MNSVVGECDVKVGVGSVVDYVFAMMSIVLLSGGIIYITTKFDNVTTLNIYAMESDKFRNKYLRRFMINNILYVVVFMIIKILIILMDVLNDKRSVQVGFLISVSMGGFLLFIVRASEPLVAKYLL